jgi:hypothetical protein
VSRTPDDKTRWCNVGDTIRCTKPLQVWPNNGRYLELILEKPEAAAYGNQLIAAGTWEVVRPAEDGE